MGPERYKTTTLDTHEFIRRFLMHVPPKGLHRIRHYGLFANGNRAANVARARELLNVPKLDRTSDDPKPAEGAEPPMLSRPCPCCGGRMCVVSRLNAAEGRNP